MTFEGRALSAKWLFLAPQRGGPNSNILGMREVSA